MPASESPSELLALRKLSMTGRRQALDVAQRSLLAKLQVTLDRVESTEGIRSRVCPEGVEAVLLEASKAAYTR